MQLYVMVAIAVGVGSVFFALQNNVPVTVNFLVWRFDSSLAMVLLLALALGALIVALVSTPGTLRRQWTISRLQKRLRQLEEELAATRAASPHIKDVNPPIGELPDPSRFVGMEGHGVDDTGAAERRDP